MLRGFALGALLLAACASPLPEYARPSGKVGSLDGLKTGNLIRYRTLTRADFLGSEPPPQVGAHRASLGAATCGLVGPSESSQIAVMPSGDGFTGFMPELRFEAWMDRDCSWWNPDFDRTSPEYVLEHEQIHFAIFELHARRLNAEAADIVRELRAHGATPQAAAAAVQARFQVRIRKALDGVLAQSQAFDEDTSMSANAARQAEWARRIEAELAASAP